MMQHHKLHIEPPADMRQHLLRLWLDDKQECLKILQYIKQNDKEIKKL